MIWGPVAVRAVAAAVVAAIVAGVMFAGYRWAHGRGVAAERARWEASTAEAGARFAEALAAQQATIAQLDRDLTDARRRANRKREGLADAIANDAASRDWSRVPVPDGVRAAIGDRGNLPADPGGVD